LAHAFVDELAYKLEDQRRMSLAKNYFAWQSQLVAREVGRRVVEIGCGIGNFTQSLLDRELVIACDIEPECIERLNHRYPHQSNLRTFACDAGDPAFSGLARFRPDSCVCLNVLEHIEDDLQALGAMASILETGGVIVLLVPAFQALYGPIDRNLSHYRRYNRKSINTLAASAGLIVQKAHYMNIVGFLGWWTNSHIFRRQAQSELQIKIFDRYIVPVLSRIEGIAYPPFGQSLFAVLRKP
jgi:2-polyprenyl-3-methyl-5-hydroxy-6-metoxy-1,4-benzoquinol methylase